MSALEMLSGRWEGTGSMTMGPGQVHGSTVHESGQFRLDRTVFMIEGIGHATEAVYGDYRLVHNELNILRYVIREQSYFMRAYRLGGQFVDAKVEIDGNVLQWGFETPGAGKISRDGGETSFPFFEMSLA